MKKIIFSLLLIFALFTGCKNSGEPFENITGNTTPVDKIVGFDTSQNPLPLIFDLEIENQIADTQSIAVGTIIFYADYSGCGSCTLEIGFKTSSGKEIILPPCQTTIVSDLILMDAQTSAKAARTVCLDCIPEEEDLKTIYPSVAYFFISIHEPNKDYKHFDYNSVDEENNPQLFISNIADPRTISTEDYDNAGGDFYYVLDPEKSGTTSFGHLVSSDTVLNGRESGHVKIKLTITQDPDTGKKVVGGFQYLGDVADPVIPDPAQE